MTERDWIAVVCIIGRLGFTILVIVGFSFACYSKLQPVSEQPSEQCNRLTCTQCHEVNDSLKSDGLRGDKRR